MRPLEALHQEFRDKGFTVIGLESWSRRGPYRLEIYRKEYGLSYPLLYEGPAYGVAAWGSPSIALFNRRGQIVAYLNRGECHWTGAAFKELITALLEGK